MRRLSKREYNNVVRDLLGDTTDPADQFGDEVYTNGFDNGSESLTVQGTDLVSLQEAAESLAANAVAHNLAALTGSCDPTQNESACIDAFLSTFPLRAYRRPPTTTELDRLRTVYAAGAAAGGFAGGIQLVIEAVLQSPSFLYREEIGAPDPSLPANVVRLTPYEVASELSFLLTGSMPDPPLFSAAQNGTLQTTNDLRREAARLLASPAARPALRSFLNQWMATDQVASANKDAMFYPQFTSALAASMATELDGYFDQILWGGTGSIREILTSPNSVVDANLAGLVYGVPAPAAGFQPIALDRQIRQGILTRAGFLTVHSDVDNSGPVQRGVFVMNALLCLPPLTPPPGVAVPLPASSAAAAHETTRQRLGMHLSEQFCMGCHSVIDGIGFGFEEFDGMGVYRTSENGSPVDTSGTLQRTDVDGPFVGVAQLAQKLTTSQEVPGCYVKQVYRYAMGDEEGPAAQEALTAMQAGFTVDSRVTDPLEALVADPAFFLRIADQPSP